MKITIEKYTPVDGDYYLIRIDRQLFAKTWTQYGAEKIRDLLLKEVCDCIVPELPVGFTKMTGTIYCEICHKKLRKE